MVAFSCNQVGIWWDIKSEGLIKPVYVVGPLAGISTEVAGSTAGELPSSVLMLVLMIAVHPCDDLVAWALVAERFVEVIYVGRCEAVSC